METMEELDYKKEWDRLVNSASVTIVDNMKTHEDDPFFIEKRKRGDELLANYRGGIPDWDRAIERAKADKRDEC